ncbi:MAG: ABC transporter substrate-binding protein [Burkholderiaceae bacterium]|nr:ABC transporter substrate-binding protein [Burkholderiaceae bacterium]
MTLKQVPSVSLRRTASRCAPLVLALSGLAFWMPSAGAEVARIGVIRTLNIPTFTRVQQGFEDGLASSGYKAGVHVTFDIQTTNNDAGKELEIAKKFNDDKVTLIHSIGTPPTLAAVKNTGLPVVFSAVTDPLRAGIVPAGSAPGKPSGTNVTGTTDPWPVEQQLKVFSQIVPKARRWGTVYTPAEPNSMYFIAELREATKRMGLELVEAPVNDSSEVAAATERLVGKVDAIFKSPDNAVSAALKAMVQVCEANKIPLFTGGNSGPPGVVASYGMDYYLVGYSAGKRAALVLRGSKAGTIPWGPVGTYSLLINLTAAKAQGITFSPDILRIADKVIE